MESRQHDVLEKTVDADDAAKDKDKSARDKAASDTKARVAKMKADSDTDQATRFSSFGRGERGTFFLVNRTAQRHLVHLREGRKIHLQTS